MQTEARDSFDPIPQQYLTLAPGIGGTIKQRPEDFLVDEQPLYEPTGEGEHLYLFVEKRNTSHFDLINALQRHFGVKEQAIGYAGMKDRMGVTRQMISIHLPGDPPTKPFEHDRISVLWMDRHYHKLRRGHLKGNRFSIRIRHVDPLHAPRVYEAIKQLEKTGVPNHFGEQRFGYRRNNHILGAAILREDWKGAVNELVGTGSTPFPEHQRERRELFDTGRYDEAYQLWSASDRSERAVLRALMQGRHEKGVVMAVGKNAWSFWISALQSAIFNRVLDMRLERGIFHTLLEGDLAWKHDTRHVFPVTAEELKATNESPPDPSVNSDGVSHLKSRLARFEISPSGPLWGESMMTTAAGTEVAGIEEQAVKDMGADLPLLRESPFAREGTRRPVRERLSNPDIEAGIDEHGHFIRVAFDLPRGVYATIVLRELMKQA